jgi:catechol 2,3-dioxygenase-like lactoylglutathione lyase family enzyme
VIAVRAATVFVADLERSVRFYVDALGFERRDDEHGTAVAPPGSPTSLVLVHPSLSEMGAERASVARQRIGEPTGLILETEDVDDVYRRLRALGVDVGPAPAPDEHGVAATTFHDPDGNGFTLVEHPTGPAG